MGLDDIIGEKLEFAGRSDGTIWVCGRRNHTGSLMPLGKSAQADAKMIAELTGRAYRFLTVHNPESPINFEELEVIGLGRAFRPATPSGRPIMSMVARSQLSVATTCNNIPGNVFLCWGHG